MREYLSINMADVIVATEALDRIWTD